MILILAMLDPASICKDVAAKTGLRAEIFLAIGHFDFLSVEQEFGADARALLHRGNLRTSRGLREERHHSLMGPISEKPAA
jgi:hypothetical protein